MFNHKHYVLCMTSFLSLRVHACILFWKGYLNLIIAYFTKFSTPLGSSKFALKIFLKYELRGGNS